MIRQIAVIGTGTMGRGIAYLAAVAGFETVIHDADSVALDAAKASIESMLRKGIERGKLSSDDAAAASERIHLAPDLEPAVRAADLIIEAVPEDLDLKKNLFAQADLFCAEETILATNTSSISISLLADSVERRDRFVGLHLFNPPHVMKLIEIVRGERTSDETVAQAVEMAERMGKAPMWSRWPIRWMD
jgi:3-hydroxyacyl-CoA dehydrogenase